MTTADQIVERDGQVNVGGEWLELGYIGEDGIPAAAEPDDATIWEQANWRHRYQAMLNGIDDTLNSYDATSQPEDRPWPCRSF